MTKETVEKLYGILEKMKNTVQMLERIEELEDAAVNLRINRVGKVEFPIEIPRKLNSNIWALLKNHYQQQMNEFENEYYKLKEN